MARLVKGLTPFTEDTPNVSNAPRGRARSPDAGSIQSPGLRPTITPVDTYVRPPEPDDLASALASINPALQRFAAAKATEPDDSLAELQRARATLSPEEFDRRSKDGSLPGIRSAASFELLGKDRAYDFLSKLSAASASFDPAQQNWETFYRQQLSDYSQGLPQDRVFQSNFFANINSGVSKMRATFADQKAQQDAQNLQSAQMNVWSNQAKDMTANGKAPEDVATSIFSDFTNNQRFLSIPFKDQQEMVLQLSDQLATAGQYSVVESLLKHERESGSYKGSLLTDREFGGRASSLMEKITRLRVADNLKQEAATAETQLDQMLLSKVNDGSISAVTDAQVPNADGGLKIYSADQLRKRAGNLAIQVSRDEAVRAKETPDQTYARELRQFSGSGLEHPQWFTTINNGYTTATINNLSGGQIPPALSDGYDLYKKLHKDGPQYVSKFTNKGATDFYEAARVAEEDLGLSRGEAMVAANHVTRDPNENDALTNAKFEDLDTAVDKAIRSERSWSSWLTFGLRGDSSGNNEGDARSEISRYAKIYARLGNSISHSLELAQDRFEKNYVPINGTFIRDDPRMPADFRQLVEQSLNEFTDFHGGETGLGLSDLTILPAGNGSGAYFIANRNDYTPLVNYPDAYITPASLEAMRQKNRDKKVQEVIDNNTAMKHPNIQVQTLR